MKDIVAPCGKLEKSHNNKRKEGPNPRLFCSFAYLIYLE